MSPSEAEVRRQLDRLLASAVFSNAGRMSRFLKFVVDKTLAGEGERLKEYVIGIEVFDRDQLLTMQDRIEHLLLDSQKAEMDAMADAMDQIGPGPGLLPDDEPMPRALDELAERLEAGRSDPDDDLGH